jgi:DNA-binding GntR family transcriptional regulator
MENILKSSRMKQHAEAPIQADHGLRRQAIVASILADVFHGRLKPGQRLVTRELADRFGVSHTPIREALIAVAAMGLIDLNPNRGAVVREVTVRDVREVCQVRRALECEAVRGACGRIDRDRLAALDADFRSHLDAIAAAEPDLIDRARELDSRLHDLIARSCGNAFLAHEINRLKTLFRAFRDLSWDRDHDLIQHRIAEESREHLAIVESLVAGDRAASARAMSRHVISGVRYWSMAIKRRPAARNRDAATPKEIQVS